MPLDFAGVTEEDAARAKLREMRLRREGYIVGGEDAGYDVRGLSRPMDVEQQAAMKEYMKANQGEFAPKTITPSGYAEIGGKRYEMPTAPYKQYRKISDADVQKATDYAAQAKAKAEEARLAEERRKERESNPQWQLGQLDVQRRKMEMERESALEKARAAEMQRVSGGGSWLGPVTGPQLMGGQNLPESVASAARIGDWPSFQSARAAEEEKGNREKSIQREFLMRAADAVEMDDPQKAAALRTQAMSLAGMAIPSEAVSTMKQVATERVRQQRARQQRAEVEQRIAYDPRIKTALLRMVADRDLSGIANIADSIARELAQRAAETGQKRDVNAMRAIAIEAIKRYAPQADEGFWSNFSMEDLLPTWGSEERQSAAPDIVFGDAPWKYRSGAAREINRQLGGY